MSLVEPHNPWVTHELLCDLIFGVPFNWLGLNGVVLTAAIAIALSFTWSYQIARLRGSSIAVSLLALVLAIETCSIHWSARPHVFTYLFFLASYYECFIANSSAKLRALKLGIIMLLWGNTHGSFPLGIAMIVLRTIGDFIETQTQRQVLLARDISAGCEKEMDGSAASNSTFSVVANCCSTTTFYWTVKEGLYTLAIALMACCLNLRGPAFIQYILSYLSSAKIHANSDEWRSFDFVFAAPAWSFIALLALLFFMWVYAKTKPRLAEFIYILFLLCSSLYAMRLIPYFALAVLPAMAVQAAELIAAQWSLHAPLLGSFLAADLRASASEFKLSQSAPLWIALSAIVSAVFLFSPALHISDFDPAQMPVRAVDYLKAHAVTGLGFAKDNWGAYLYWKLNRPIFIDDKTDFYSQNLLDDYTKIFLTTPGWQASFAKYPFQYVLIPPGLPLQFLLRDQKSIWQESYNSGDAVVFTRIK
jgi:hypothetical protein